MRVARILIVEDDDNIRQGLADLLGDEGYQVAAARNGLDALQQLADMDQPALILLDLSMPVMDGWTFHERIQHDPRLVFIPVVIMSAEHSGKRKALAIGAEAYLSKPFQIDQLLSTVQLYCESQSGPHVGAA